jgi:methylenetetrahydrofolate reductase (NADPH)
VFPTVCPRFDPEQSTVFP